MSGRMSQVPCFTWSQVCARRLERHALSTPSTTARPADIVAAMAGTHAQVLSAAELAIGLRMSGATRVDVRTALWSEQSLVKTFGQRGTVHLFPTRDLPLWVAALSAVPEPKFSHPAHIRLSEEQTAEVVAAVGDALKDAELTIDELSEEVIHRTGPWAGDLVIPGFQGLWPRWRQALHLAGMRGTLCFGPNRGRKVTYTNPARWLPDLAPADPQDALRHVLTSYLHAYGPATPQQFAHWLNAPVRWAADLFASLADALQPVEVEGSPAWVAAGDTAMPDTPPRGLHLLPYFDGYAYRVGNQPPQLLYPGDARERVLRGNFQVLIVDGVVGGLWHQRRSGRKLAVTVESLVQLSAAQRSEIEHRVARIGEILEATPQLTFGPVTVGGHA
ncbi:winged helix DNA-binding domain-containing protein [Streptomyces sp. NPDC059788]|uniref:winged helix DNA-binding domain-containing protein n=1 Tax=Streptomyces sp. NPDC059788 TaxID=3346948 RepID=UPI0036632F33